ncbi:hypothetical protein K2173_010774 [Erythroxylum novogranatense]|uniref:Secreted protein n=1 Tax=Erythroxylum novogranatense TaxID=1862640 RepID=A0AAV8SRT8_9ROSI|nr:hypothetical protein K2173_010774 [Erythroxylum novogranatense]
MAPCMLYIAWLLLLKQAKRCDAIDVRPMFRNGQYLSPITRSKTLLETPQSSRHVSKISRLFNCLLHLTALYQGTKHLYTLIAQFELFATNEKANSGKV